MPKVLSVGQCGPDHGSISWSLRNEHGAEVSSADTPSEALELLRSGTYQLVLVNRVFDADGSSGLELIRAIKTDPALSGVPVMLVSNFPDAQREAEAIGALPGFGKAQITASATRERLKAVLAAS
jgi:two-component system, chemotaxis family, chemotaxis protein CheY